MKREDFEAAVERAWGRIPESFRGQLEGVEVSVQDRPGPEAEEDEGSKDLLGLFVGPTRQDLMEEGALPDLPPRILLYRLNLTEAFPNRAELILEISRTLRHEIAHYFGIEDEELEEFWPEGA